jgi:membrane-associated protease RseP (regulator of RpoE activity)
VSAPAQPERGVARRSLERLAGLVVVVGGAALKWGFVFAKFFGFFISVAAYTFWFGSWTFALGFALLILVHELGHAFEARRQGLHVSLPTFVPFVGAFVTIRHAGLSPGRNAAISLAGPLAGGAAAAAVWAWGAATGSHQLETLANLGFLLNAFNLLPVGFLDGGTVYRSAGEAWRLPVVRYEGDVPVEAFAPDRARAVLIASLYAALAVALVLGLLATRSNGTL